MVKSVTCSTIIHNIKAPAQKLLPPASKIKPKKIRSNDILFFRQYIFSKGLQIQTTEAEIQKLFQLEGDDFFIASFEFLFNKLGIPQSLKPQIVELPQSNEVGMAYEFCNNWIIKNPNAPKATKIETYSFIRHELQHMLQNLDIMRHKQIGETAVKTYSELLTNNQMIMIENNIRNVPIEVLKLQGQPKETLTEYQLLKNLLQENKESEFKEYIEKIRQLILEQNITRIGNFRNLVLNEMGYLKEGSRAERRAEKFFNNINNNYFQENGKVHTGKYSTDVREAEAIIAGEVALDDIKHYLGEDTCYIKKLKSQFEDLINNKEKYKEQIEQICESTDELVKKESINSVKEYADYLFD